MTKQLFGFRTSKDFNSVKMESVSGSPLLLPQELSLNEAVSLIRQLQVAVVEVNLFQFCKETFCKEKVEPVNDGSHI